MSSARPSDRWRLIHALSALIPEVGPAGHAVLPDQRVRRQVRALRDALRAASIDWNAARAAMGRLRALYLDRSAQT